MEKYVKPNMMLEEIRDEVCTAVAMNNGTVTATAMVSGDTTTTVTVTPDQPVQTLVDPTTNLKPN